MKGKSKLMLISAAIIISFICCACTKKISNPVTTSSSVATSTVTHNDSSIPIELAENYFSKIKKICDDDNGSLWGRNLYGPMLIIDSITLDVVANEPDNEGLLEKRGRVYIGKFPKDAIVSNSITKFGNKDWSMVDWTALPHNDGERNMLICHEMFHYQQRLLNLINEADGGYDNNHMDEMEARISIQLEWNALISALKAQGEERQKAIIDALTIRYDRREQFSSADNENKFEVHEGMPDYTGLKLCYSDSQELLAAVEKKQTYLLDQPSFVRNFGYLSGTLYGLLLDALRPNWKHDLKYNSDLGELLKNTCNIQTIGSLTKETKSKYNFEQISKKEADIKSKKDKNIAEYTNKFTQQPTLTIPSDNWNYSFDPGTLQPLPDLGTVYPTIEIKDAWGTLKVNEGGCLMVSDNSKAIVSAQVIEIKGNKITGNGWILTLKDGYKVKKDGRNYITSKISK